MLRQIRSFLSHIKFSIRNRSYSQLGEDLVIANQLGRLKEITAKTYLDIGAYHFSILSNTYSLYKNGWHGTVVDCNHDKLKLFKYFRPKDRAICAAVVPNDYEKDSIEISSTGAFDGRESVVNNINIHSTAISKGTLTDVNAIRIKDLLSQVIVDKGLPTLLSIDIEGLDEIVIKDIDFAKEYPVPIVCIEQFLSNFTSNYSILSYRDSLTTQHMIDNGYSLTSVCGPSCIYIKNDCL